uniref:Mitochondrial mRNA-processing protein COX24 C-terminal domain-containing protein n=1 Tax=Peronospora matthiolae TaxID=2874970 RepID=A0AAV1VFR4_9STRA
MLCSRLLSMATGALAPAPLLPSLATRVAVTGVRSVPSTSNWFSFDTTESPVPMELLNRNARRPKKANHGKRPCSHFRRRQKRLGAKKA